MGVSCSGIDVLPNIKIKEFLLSARLETPVICDKCGFSSLSKSGMTRHKKMCDTIPAGRELEEVIDPLEGTQGTFG